MRRHERSKVAGPVAIALAGVVFATMTVLPLAVDADTLDLRGDFLVGRASMKTYGDSQGRGPGRYTGWYGGFIVETWLGGMPTLHGFSGLHTSMEMTVAMPGMIARDDEGLFEVPEHPTLWLVGLEFAAGPAWSLYRKGKTSLTMGVDGFLGTERRGFAVSGRFIFKGVAIAGALRHGATWGGAQMYEQVWRVGMARLRTKRGKTIERGLGLQFTHGYAEDARGRADLSGFFKGGYTSVAVYGSFAGGMQ